MLEGYYDQIASFPNESAKTWLFGVPETLATM